MLTDPNTGRPTPPPIYRDTVNQFALIYTGARWIEAVRLCAPALDELAARTGAPPEYTTSALAYGLEVEKAATTSELYTALAVIGCAADGKAERSEAEEVQRAVNMLRRALFSVPGVEGIAAAYPEGFWQAPIGKMLARALLWLNEGHIITMTEATRRASKMVGRKIIMSTIVSWVRNGLVTAYFDPDAPGKNGRWLVDWREVEPRIKKLPTA